MDEISSGARRAALVLAGGVGLGAYQAGVYAVLHEDAALRADWLAGSSVGAVNCALIAGNAPGHRVERLRAFWMHGGPWLPRSATGLVPAWEHFHGWMSAIQARLMGVPGHFRPRLQPPLQGFSSFYDLAPMQRRLEQLVDFDRLNGGDVRVAIATTDIESGDAVFFDTGKGHRIGMDHLLASCGFLPEFAPVEIGGRALGGGGLTLNAPIEAVLDENQSDARICFVVDLYARDGARPDGLEAALARKNDLLFGNQTYQRLKAWEREQALAQRFADTISRLPSDVRKNLKGAATIFSGGAKAVFYLSYRPSPAEPGPEKPFDLSRPAVERRWEAGALDMAEALQRLGEVDCAANGPALITVRRPMEQAA